MLVIKYGYMFRLILSHPQANMVTEFRYIKCAVHVNTLSTHRPQRYTGTTRNATTTQCAVVYTV